MIIDSSALIAIARDEPDASRYATAVRDAPSRRISAANWLEASIVIDRLNDPVTSAIFESIVTRLKLTIEPVTEAQARIAREAHAKFGRGSGHPARLNFGDCFAYALAKALDEPLLYKGDDFSKTDIPFVGRSSERRRLSELIAAYG